MTLRLRKTNPGRAWPQLLDARAKRPSNMHTWWKMQAQFDEEGRQNNKDNAKQATNSTQSSHSASDKGTCVILGAVARASPAAPQSDPIVLCWLVFPSSFARSSCLSCTGLQDWRPSRSQVQNCRRLRPWPCVSRCRGTGWCARAGRQADVQQSSLYLRERK